MIEIINANNNVIMNENKLIPDKNTWSYFSIFCDKSGNFEALARNILKKKT